jgi:tRNA (guanine37-N1)-methyltransferase
MNIDIITLFPEMFKALAHSIPGRAQESGLLSLKPWNPRDYTTSKHGCVDDRPYGGGPGMVMQYQPIRDTINAIRKASNTGPVIYLSPQGKPFIQNDAAILAKQPSLILLCGRYEGLDQRIIDRLVDQEISLGDFVTSGGELPAMMMIDAITRLLPGSLGDAQSSEQDSFSDGLLDHPHYTRPELIDDMSVPSVLVGGDHQAIERWRLKESLGNTWQKRPDLVKSRIQNEFEQALLEEYQAQRAEEKK